MSANTRILLLALIAIVLSIGCVVYITLSHPSQTTTVSLSEDIEQQVDGLKDKLDIPPNYKIVKDVEGKYYFATEEGHVSTLSEEDTYEEAVEGAWSFYEYEQKKKRTEELKKQGKFFTVIQE